MSLNMPLEKLNILSLKNSYSRKILTPNPVNKIERSLNFENYIIKCNIIQPEFPLSVNEKCIFC